MDPKWDLNYENLGRVLQRSWWNESLGECNEICYKDPVLKDRQWTAYIDRSPGADSYSLIKGASLKTCVVFEARQFAFFLRSLLGASPR
ncbi:hypothetical protein Sjap_006449 [Stephania japonica]|uniref:Uncharacterized protein n=1 Tax=Stephania japonica TaxID=461633 RepID=A0AAP0PMT6_9MAGN